MAMNGNADGNGRQRALMDSNGPQWIAMDRNGQQRVAMDGSGDSWHSMSYYAMASVPFHGMSCHVVLGRDMPSHAMACLDMTCHALRGMVTCHAISLSLGRHLTAMLNNELPCQPSKSKKRSP